MLSNIQVGTVNTVQKNTDITDSSQVEKKSPISPSQVDFWATESIIELAKREKKEILILINRANAKSKLIKEAVKFVKDMEVKKAKTILGNRQIFVSSMGLGLTVVEKQRTGKGCLEMLSLAKEIKSLLQI